MNLSIKSCSVTCDCGETAGIKAVLTYECKDTGLNNYESLIVGICEACSQNK